MRVLLTTPTYPPYNSGLGNAVQQQATALAAQGCEVTVATGGKTRASFSEYKSGIKIETFAVRGASSLLTPIKGDISGYIAFLEETQFDYILINAWQNWATDILLSRLTSISGKKYLYSHCISTNVFYPSHPLRSIIRYCNWRPYWWKLRRFISQLDGIIFLSDQGDDSRFDDLKLAQNLKTKLHVIPNSLSKEAEAASQESNPNFSQRNQIISVGSYQWQKGFDFVLQAYALSTAKNKIPLIFFGQKQSEYTDYLRNLAKKLHIEERYIDFQVGISGSKLLNEYSKSTLFISGSHTECQPLVLLDANATGTPFVARKTGCISTMPGGLSITTTEEAAREIDTLLLDKQKWSELSAQGRNAATTKYHPDNTVLSLLDTIRTSSQD